MPANPAPQPAEDKALARRRRGRNIAMFVVLAALVVLFYAITMVKMSHHGVAH